LANTLKITPKHETRWRAILDEDAELKCRHVVDEDLYAIAESKLEESLKKFDAAKYPQIAHQVRSIQSLVQGIMVYSDDKSNYKKIPSMILVLMRLRNLLNENNAKNLQNYNAAVETICKVAAERGNYLEEHPTSRRWQWLAIAMVVLAFLVAVPALIVLNALTVMSAGAILIPVLLVLTYALGVSLFVGGTLLGTFKGLCSPSGLFGCFNRGPEPHQQLYETMHQLSVFYNNRNATPTPNKNTPQPQI